MKTKKTEISIEPWMQGIYQKHLANAGLHWDLVYGTPNTEGGMVVLSVSHREGEDISRILDAARMELKLDGRPDAVWEKDRPLFAVACTLVKHGAPHKIASTLMTVHASSKAEAEGTAIRRAMKDYPEHLLSIVLSVKAD